MKRGKLPAVSIQTTLGEKMATNKLHDLFEKHEDEFLKFERIKKADRRHPMKDLCGMLYLFEKLGGKVGDDAIDSAGHDQIYFSWGKLKKLKEEDVIYLLRCGISYDDGLESLWKFV